MSYSVTGVAAIAFPVQTLQNDAYSVPGSHRSITPQTSNTQGSIDLSATPNKVIAQGSSAASAPNPVEVKQSSPVDTVTLSTSQKVLQLQQEGESALQIAATLNLPAKEVQSDLHVETRVAQSFTVSPVTTPLSGNTTATVSVPTGGA